MDRARRLALGIPVHDTEAEHTFMDGYCCCGASNRKEHQGPAPARYGTRDGGTRGRVDLDRVEGNREEYF